MRCGAGGRGSPLKPNGLVTLKKKTVWCGYISKNFSVTISGTKVISNNKYYLIVDILDILNIF